MIHLMEEHDEIDFDFLDRFIEVTSIYTPLSSFDLDASPSLIYRKGGLIDPRLGIKYNSIGTKKRYVRFDFNFEEIQNLFKYWIDN